LYGYTLLSNAYKIGNIAIIKYLFENGTVSKKYIYIYSEIIFKTYENGYKIVVKYLVENDILRIK